VSSWAKTETVTREYDDRGRLTAETVTTVERKPVIELPPGFRAPAGQPKDAP
jgi:hypothetical protein